MLSFYIGLIVVAVMIVFLAGAVCGMAFVAWLQKESELVDELDFILPEEKEGG